MDIAKKTLENNRKPDPWSAGPAFVFVFILIRYNICFGSVICFLLVGLVLVFS